MRAVNALAYAYNALYIVQSIRAINARPAHPPLTREGPTSAHDSYLPSAATSRHRTSRPVLEDSPTALEAIQFPERHYMRPAFRTDAAPALLAIATALTGCDARTAPTTTVDALPASRAAGPVYTEYGAGERGCAAFEVRISGRDRIEVVPTNQPACGPVQPVIAGAPTFDVTKRAVRLPVALENRSLSVRGAPARLLAWEDSLQVLAAPGLDKNKHAREYLVLVAADSQSNVNDPASGGLKVWRYDDRLASAGQAQLLRAGQRSDVRWIELTTHPGVETFRVVLHARAREQVESVTALVGPQGATLSLPGFTAVTFRTGTFTTAQQVTVSATSTVETQTDWAATAEPLFNPGGRSPRELRINTGAVQPRADLDVTLTIPEALAISLPQGHRITAFGQWFSNGGQDIHDEFEVLPTEVDLVARRVRLTVPAAMFTGQRSADGSYEAVVVLSLYDPGAPAQSAAITGLSPSFSLSAADDGSGAAKCEAAPLGSPLRDPLRVTGPYNPPAHKGTDYGADTGEDVLAMRDGIIERVGFDERPLTKPDPRSGKMVKGWGRYVKVRHEDGTTTLYAHMVRNSTDGLAAGQHVSKGTKMGLSNNTGGSSGPHLHVEYREPDGSTMNPHPCVGAKSTRTYRGYWVRSGSSYQYNPFEAVVTRVGSQVSVEWMFLPDDVRQGTATLSGNDVVWSYTAYHAPVTHRITVTFMANGCQGTWHHDYIHNNFYQTTNTSICWIVDGAQIQSLQADPLLAPPPPDSVQGKKN